MGNWRKYDGVYKGVHKGAWRVVQSDAQIGGQRGVSSNTQRVERCSEAWRGAERGVLRGSWEVLGGVHTSVYGVLW